MIYTSQAWGPMAWSDCLGHNVLSELLGSTAQWVYLLLWAKPYDIHLGYCGRDHVIYGLECAPNS